MHMVRDGDSRGDTYYSTPYMLTSRKKGVLVVRHSVAYRSTEHRAPIIRGDPTLGPAAARASCASRLAVLKSLLHVELCCQA
jgi:hypothetical protein